MPRKLTQEVTSQELDKEVVRRFGSQLVNLDDGFPELLRGVKTRFELLVHGAGVERLFRTEAVGLFDLFLRELPPELRQHYTCRACRDFIDRYGGLVTIDSSGIATSVLWSANDITSRFYRSEIAMGWALQNAPIAGVFVSPDKVWGEPVTGVWHHFAVKPPAGMVFDHKLSRHDKESAEKFRERQLAVAGAEMARLREEYLMLSRGLGEFPLDVCRKAAVMLRSGQLDRSEKCEGVADWLVELQQRLDGEKNRRCREGMVWLAAATAPTGYCHVRSGLIGTLLEDIQVGMPFQEMKARFDAKVYSFKYQRPTVTLKAGTILQAEKLFEELRSAGALGRRFAKFSDVQKLLWMPRSPRPAQVPPVGGLFAHLKQPSTLAIPTDVGPQTITWVKFRDTVLPSAESIEYGVPASGRHGYAAMTAAADPASPPILQWDVPEQRNTVAVYCYVGGSPSNQWNLQAASWTPVEGVAPLPQRWNPALRMDHHADGAMFILRGCRDTQHSSGGGLFVETLKSEYHGVRSVLEAHFAGAPIAEHDEQHACGLMIGAGTKSCRHVFRVVAGGLRTAYTIDRWD